MDFSLNLDTLFYFLLNSLLPGVAILLAVLVMGTPLRILRYYHDKQIKLPIDKEKLLRLPGAGLQNEITDKQFDLIGMVTIGLGAILAPFASAKISTLWAQNTFPSLEIIMVCTCLSIIAFKVFRLSLRLSKLRLGYLAEQATASELIALQAKGYQIFHDIQADGFNIDHLAAGPNGVFAIETKGRHKRKKDGSENYKMRYQNSALHFPSWTETKPLKQAERQAKWVSEWLSKAVGSPISAIPVLVFPGWWVALNSKPPFPILNQRQLVTSLPKSNQPYFSAEQINAISYQVAQRCLSGEKL